MGTRGWLLTEEQDRKVKALGKSRYNLSPNQQRELDSDTPVVVRFHHWDELSCRIMYHSVHHTQKTDFYRRNQQS